MGVHDNIVVEKTGVEYHDIARVTSGQSVLSSDAAFTEKGLSTTSSQEDQKVCNIS